MKTTPSDLSQVNPSNVIHANFQPKKIGVKYIVVEECSSSVFRPQQVLKFDDFERKCTEEAVNNGSEVTDVSGYILFTNNKRFFFDLELSSMQLDCHLNLQHAFDAYIESVKGDTAETFVMCLSKDAPEYDEQVKEMTKWYNFVSDFNNQYKLEQEA